MKLAYVSAGLGVEIVGILIISAAFYPCQAHSMIGAKGCAGLGGILMFVAGMLIGIAR
jgi:hypothetical protein